MGRIQHLKRNDIDTIKWNNCMRHAANSLVYASSDYLDAMAKNWDALVLNDYEAVMPLTWNKKWGIHYLYQPPFTAALGVFGNQLHAGVVQEFLEAVPSYFKFWDFYLNHQNCFTLTSFQMYQRMNFVLPLNAPYEELYSNFKSSTQRNIKKFTQLKGEIEKNIPVEAVAALSKQQSAGYNGTDEDGYNRFLSLYSQLHQTGKAITYGAFCNGALLASAVFIFDERRAYYILVGNHPNGKTIGASHALINAFIQDYSNTGLLLDFEGSDIASLAFFYSSFGAAEEIYCGIKKNALPWPLKWLKQ